MDASDVQFFAPGQPLCVLTTQPLDRLLDYRAPEGGAATGAFVEVPLGPRKVLGVVWGAAQGDYPVARMCRRCATNCARSCCARRITR